MKRGVEPIKLEFILVELIQVEILFFLDIHFLLHRFKGLLDVDLRMRLVVHSDSGAEEFLDHFSAFEVLNGRREDVNPVDVGLEEAFNIVAHFLESDHLLLVRVVVLQNDFID